MARTPSNMMPLGTQAPDFSLSNPRTGEQLSLSEAQGNKGTLIMFICNHCPYVIHLKNELGKLSDYMPQGLGIVAISSNDVESYPADAPDKMVDFAQENGFKFPYLYDESQSVARDYNAACTPDFFLFDTHNKCVYRGRYDASTPGNNEDKDGKDLLGAVDALLADKPVSPEQQPSIGCNIKWK